MSGKKTRKKEKKRQMQLQSLITDQLSFEFESKEKLQILVPVPGKSKLFDLLYDAGFKSIITLNLSRMTSNQITRPNWYMTSKQSDTEIWDAILDEGELEAMMEPELRNIYLSKVKRIIKVGGRFICLTSGYAHFLVLLFEEFLFGWKMSLIPSYSKTYMVVVVAEKVVAEKDKDSSTAVYPIIMDKSVEPDRQVPYLSPTVEKENEIRSRYIFYSLKELLDMDISKIKRGRRLNVILEGCKYMYHGILLDLAETEEPFHYDYGAFIVLQNRPLEWEYSTEEQLQYILNCSNDDRLLMITLDSSNSNADIEYIKEDLSPLVKQLAPSNCRDSHQIQVFDAPGIMAQPEIVHKVISPVTGPILVEDVLYLKNDERDINIYGADADKYRRLIFQRNENLVQSEARFETVFTKQAPEIVVKVDHNHLASLYHAGIISGILLISTHLKDPQGPKKAAVIGLGAGLLPMFMKNILPTLMIEVVELDPVVLEVAREYFDFPKEDDELLKVHITDGVEFVKKRASTEADGKFDILIVDVDSAETSSGLTCPPTNFVDESFLLTVKDSLVEKGLFIINLVSGFSAIKHDVKLKMQKVFSSVFTIELEKDVNEVIFAVKTPIQEYQLSEAGEEIANSFPNLDSNLKEKVLDLTKSMKPHFLGE